MSRKRVLVACTTAIGDTILSTAAIIALGRTFELDVLVHDHRRPLLEHNPYIRQLYSYRNNGFHRLSVRYKLKDRKYYRLLVMHANNDILKLIPHLNYEVAANIQGWNQPENKLVSLAMPVGVHMVDKRLLLAHWAGAEIPVHGGEMQMFLRREEEYEAEDWLRHKGLVGIGSRVGLVLGASHIFKRWPADRFGWLASRLMEQGTEVIILGSKSELPLAHIAQKAAGRPLTMGHGLTMRMLAAVLSRLDVLVSNDTGPLHLGQAVGTKVLGLFGPTDPFTIGPRHSKHRVLKVPSTCTPCLTKTCPTGDCMKALAKEAVLEMVNNMLSEIRADAKTGSL